MRVVIMGLVDEGEKVVPESITVESDSPSEAAKAFKEIKQELEKEDK